MTRNRFPLKGDAARAYETHKVPAIFEPLASRTLEHVEIRPEARVIDVACGTGIVARLAAPKAGPSGRVVGVDLNEHMLEVARAAPDGQAETLTWQQGDVTALPFAADSFDVAFCQQGLQFFPDKAAALTEMRRVLGHDGRLAITVWNGPSPLFVAIAEALVRHIGETAAEKLLSPYALRDGAEIERLVREAGFGEVARRVLTLERRIGAASTSIPGEIAGNPAGVDFAARAPATQERIVAEVAEDLAAYRTAEGFAVPQESHLVVARAAR